uniref:Cytochrome c oxidase subunit 3 n=1 Tax=Paraleius leontonychus TaxID=1807943 RepID=A0A330JEZ0_9ACAR|nr:cytochrome c oxidase subunit III [Paraleius leontonychus]
MTHKFNPFHLVDVSPWPILASNSALAMVLSGLILLNSNMKTPALISFLMTATVAFMWWKDVHREASIQGHHSYLVMNGLKTGMILFIISEVFFFVSFFWAFLHSSISPTIELGQAWPPNGISPFNPMSIPLLNTILLLSSGVTVTWSHHALLKGNFKTAVISLNTTILLGAIFSGFQAFEYISAPFTISDTSFGSSFFMATGFHGLHVIIGSIFLFFSMKRLKKMINSMTHMVGFECAAWYWHFVDIVWLFLYSMIYWWGA